MKKSLLPILLIRGNHCVGSECFGKNNLHPHAESS
jgi:hypothetical protein